VPAALRQWAALPKAKAKKKQEGKAGVGGIEKTKRLK